MVRRLVEVFRWSCRTLRRVELIALLATSASGAAFRVAIPAIPALTTSWHAFEWLGATCPALRYDLKHFAFHLVSRFADYCILAVASIFENSPTVRPFNRNCAFGDVCTFLVVVIILVDSRSKLHGSVLALPLVFDCN